METSLPGVLSWRAVAIHGNGEHGLRRVSTFSNPSGDRTSRRTQHFVGRPLGARHRLQRSWTTREVAPQDASARPSAIAGGSCEPLLEWAVGVGLGSGNGWEPRMDEGGASACVRSPGLR